MGALLAGSVAVMAITAQLVTRDAVQFLRRNPGDKAAFEVSTALEAGTLVLQAVATLVSGLWAWNASRQPRPVKPGTTAATLREPPSPDNAGPHADTDALTGLPNQRGLVAQLEALDKPVVVALIDLNALKHVNSRGGHSVGDAYLREVASDLKALLPDNALLSRWGGAAFLVALPGLSEAEASKRLDRAIDRMRRPIPELTAFTYGVATHATGAPLDRALALADAQLHERRAEGKAGRPATGEYSVDALEEFNAQLHTLGNPIEVIERGLPLARRILGFDVTFYLEVGTQKGEPVPVRALGLEGHAPPSLKDQLGQPEALRGLRWLRRGHSAADTVFSNDYPSEPSTNELWVQVGVKSTLFVPVINRGRLAGVLVFLALERWRGVTPPVRQLAETVARRLGDLLDQHRLNELVHKAAAQSLSTLGLALETRHVETQGHTERVTRMAVTLGRWLRLDARQLESLRQGALLHDVGKLAIPDAILNKAGQLDPEERAVIETHSIRGFELASKLPGITDEALAVVRHHHERWDGTGYPDRLASVKIPLLARIFTVCDVFDALTHERVYKEPWPVESALEELQRQAAKQFDPHVVSVFVQMVRAQQHEAQMKATRAVRDGTVN